MYWRTGWIRCNGCGWGGGGGGGVGGGVFFFNDTATTEIYTLSLHDALPIYMPLQLLYNATAIDTHAGGDVAIHTIL